MAREQRVREELRELAPARFVEGSRAVDDAVVIERGESEIEVVAERVDQAQWGDRSSEPLGCFVMRARIGAEAEAREQATVDEDEVAFTLVDEHGHQHPLVSA